VNYLSRQLNAGKNQNSEYLGVSWQKYNQDSRQFLALTFRHPEGGVPTLCVLGGTAGG